MTEREIKISTLSKALRPSRSAPVLRLAAESSRIADLASGAEASKNNPLAAFYPTLPFAGDNAE